MFLKTINSTWTKKDYKMITKRNFLKLFTLLPFSFLTSKQSKAKEIQEKTLMQVTSFSNEVPTTFSVVQNGTVQNIKTWLNEDFGDLKTKNLVKIISDTENEFIFEIHSLYEIYRIYAHNAIEWNQPLSFIQGKTFLYPINCWAYSTMNMDVFKKVNFHELEIRSSIPIYKFIGSINKTNWDKIVNLIANFVEFESDQIP